MNLWFIYTKKLPHIYMCDSLFSGLEGSRTPVRKPLILDFTALLSNYILFDPNLTPI